jgi:hypothetical protein
MSEAYERQRTADGVLPATLEIVCAQAWSRAPGARGGEIEVPVARLRRR